MSDYDGNIIFKEWLPDQPDLNNPGLTEARNTLLIDGNYVSYPPGVESGTVPAASIICAQRATGFFNVTLGAIYAAGTATAGTRVYISDALDVGSTWIDLTPSTSFNATSAVDIVQYNNLIIVTNGVNPPIYGTFGSTSTMGTLSSTMGTAPIAACAGIVGQFVVLGNLPALGYQFAVQWSGIDAPLNWPTPNSATAVAQQSGIQYLDPLMNAVKGISNGDQWALILQDGGLVRMTYANSSVVFDFAQIYRGPGPIGQKAWVQIGALVYFASAAGFFVSDGVQTVPIGNGIIDRYFLSRVDRTQLPVVRAGVDYARGLIYWTLPKSSDAATGKPEEMLVYNFRGKKWTHVFDTVKLIVGGNESLAAPIPIEGFSNANKLIHFTGTPGTAILTTGETEPNPGGFSRMQGIKPLVDVTVNAVTVAMGTRNDRTSSVGYTSEVTANSRSGFCNFRSEARYHRARLTIAGTFNAAQGLEYEAVPSGFT